MNYSRYFHWKPLSVIALGSNRFLVVPLLKLSRFIKLLIMLAATGDDAVQRILPQ